MSQAFLSQVGLRIPLTDAPVHQPERSQGRRGWTKACRSPLPALRPELAPSPSRGVAPRLVLRPLDRQAISGSLCAPFCLRTPAAPLTQGRGEDMSHVMR